MSHLMDLFWRNSIDLAIKQFDVFLTAIVKETLAEVQGKLFAVVGCHTYLPLELSLGGIELKQSKRCAHQTVEFASHQSQTALDIGVIAAEVDSPRPRVTIVDECALYGVDQSVSLT